MKAVTITEAKAQLSRLVSELAAGESFVITRAGTPVARVVSLESLAPAVSDQGGKRKLGFLKGKFKSPVDFKAFAREEIDEMFFGNPDKFTVGKQKK